MTELEKIAYAKTFLDQLADGINPLDATFIPDDELITHTRIDGCFRYVSGILGRVIENGGVDMPEKRGKKTAFAMSNEILKNFRYSDTPIAISDMLKQLNAMRRADEMKRLTYRAVAQWLVSIDALEVYTDSLGRIKKRPTENGRALGISVETRVGAKGEYPIVVYDRFAQQFIVENLYEILAAED